ncbi:MAG: nitrite/sulfite reductase [Alphaproteobacteria bacterium]|nr:nitrite/sulfite reductase [Alphaproteobacteria bacterium]
MYRYDAFDQTLVDERVEQFRDQVARRLSGALSEDQFRPLRLLNGLYLQLHAYMLRVAIPYGTLSSRQLRTLAHIARTFDRGYGHFTTRQNIQFNWVRLDQAADILAALASVEMHAIQTSGNTIRNVTADHLAGVAADEIEDPRIYAEIIRQWSTLHPEFSFLPRKFKIAVTGAARDRTALKVHDIGIQVVRDAAGEAGFSVLVGGGQGRTPMIGHVIRPFLPKADLLAYLEAILRVYNEFGRRDNLYKARIKILVQTLGPAAFTAMVEEQWQALRGPALALPDEELARIAAHFAPPTYARLPAASAALAAARAEPVFERWCRHNLLPHKQPGYAIATISLKPEGGVPGDATAAQLEALADLAERWSLDEVRVSHEQNLVLPHVRQDDVPALWRELRAHGLATPNAGLITDIIACPGLDYCNLANARSIPIAQQIQRRFANRERQEEIGAIKIKISGCINACGHHHVGHIGILGVDKKGAEFYQITLGGDGSERAALGEITGRAFAAAEVVDAIDTIIDTYLGARRHGEAFIDTYRRVGMVPFKEALYGAH